MPAAVTGRAVSVESREAALKPAAALAADELPVGGRKPDCGLPPAAVPAGCEPVGGRIPTGSRPPEEGGRIPGGAPAALKGRGAAPPLLPVGGRMGPLAGTGTATGPRAGRMAATTTIEESDDGQASKRKRWSLGSVQRRISQYCCPTVQRSGRTGVSLLAETMMHVDEEAGRARMIVLD